MKLSDLQSGDIFGVYVKPRSSATAYVGFDADLQMHVISIAAPTDKGKANKELLAFLRKEFSLECAIRTGKTSRKKLLVVQ